VNILTIPPGLTLEAIRAEKNRRRWLTDPVAWCRERTGGYLWSKQRAIVESVRDRRRTAVPSCHDAGKSYVAAQLVAWWIDTHPPGEARVVTTAPTGRQVRAILWHEIGRVFAKAQLPGRVNQTQWYRVGAYGKEELVAFGAKPADMDPAAFQGVHERYVLVIFDEADGIPKSLWDAAEGLISNEEARILAIGNPVNPTSEFAKVCEPGSIWHTVPINAFETPNFTDEAVPDRLRPLLVQKVWVDEVTRKWGVDNPLYIAKVLGRFPPHGGDNLIPIEWIRQAQDREIEPAEPSELGVDVGGGNDKSVVAHRRGGHVRIIRSDTNPDTMATCGNIIKDLRTTGARIARVDVIGIGRGVVDRAKEIAGGDQSTGDKATTARLAKKIVGVNVGTKPRDEEQYMNLKAEAAWALREWFQRGLIDIDPADKDLAAQLVTLKNKTTSTGKNAMVSKEELKRSGLDSPDRADAVILAFMPTMGSAPGAITAGAAKPDPMGRAMTSKRL